MDEAPVKEFLRTDQALLLQADVITGLRSLQAESVHCAVSSPPYLGLRDYGTAPTLWGGENSCAHSWTHHTYYHHSPIRTGSEHRAALSADLTHRQRWSLSETCLRCGAWRGQLGLEPLHDCLAWARGEPPCPRCYICHIRTVFLELRRVLRQDGTVWWNVGDCYNGSGGSGGDYLSGGLKQGQPMAPGRTFKSLGKKNLIGIPWRTALAVQADGWIVRSDVIWHKPNGMPESVTDRPASSHEHVFLFSRERRYFYDLDASREPRTSERITRDTPSLSGRARRDVWTIPTQPYRGTHFACFPPKLIEPCLLSGTSEKGCCRVCGAPWKRQVSRGNHLIEWQKACGADAGGNYHGKSRKDYETAGVVRPADLKSRILRSLSERITTGWTPTCACCAGGPVPCTVLDPFAGSGTTGAVALSQGRRFIGIELKKEYCQLAVERIQAAANTLEEANSAKAALQERPSLARLSGDSGR